DRPAPRTYPHTGRPGTSAAGAARRPVQFRRGAAEVDSVPLRLERRLRDRERTQHDDHTQARRPSASVVHWPLSRSSLIAERTLEDSRGAADAVANARVVRPTSTGRRGAVIDMCTFWSERSWAVRKRLP